MNTDGKGIEIGRLLRSGISGFVAGCRVFKAEEPSFGALVQAPLGPQTQIYGLIYDMHIDDDGLVRQLVTAEGVDDNVIADNRVNRNVPLEMSVLAVGYREGGRDGGRGGGRIFHLLPPRPPLSLDMIYLCGPDELCAFTAAGHFGYFRHILRAADLPVSEILAAHLKQANDSHCANGNPDWARGAMQELITLLRDDYQTLMRVLGALSDALPFTDGVRPA